jgi:Undecaprenyl-phosphate galactose phosphotransferase WbaP
MGSLLLAGDLLVVALSTCLAIILWMHINPTLNPADYVDLIPTLILFGIVYALAGLYPAVGLNQVDELRRLTVASTIVFLGLGTLTFYIRNAILWSRAVFGIAWVLSLIVLPQGRKLIRWAACRNGWWGEPVAVIGNGTKSTIVCKQLARFPEFGLKPVVVIDGYNSSWLNHSLVIQKANILSPSDIDWNLKDIQTVILVMDEIEPKLLNDLAHDSYANFARTIMIMDDYKVGFLGAQPYDFGGILGFGVKQNLLSAWQQGVKRLVDLFLILICRPILLLVFLILTIAIRLDSPGAVFYRQKRLGKEGKDISIWKFRTMVKDADEILVRYLKNDPALQAEWDSSHKLKHDPRITSVGSFLRRTSMDELPQLINVFLGEMSLVGPRPIVEDEKRFYGNSLKFYQRVTPGMSGLWQISGRNDLSYSERIQLDEYYVRNWSIWLDFYIFESTLWTIISGKGAY